MICKLCYLIRITLVAALLLMSGCRALPDAPESSGLLVGRCISNPSSLDSVELRLDADGTYSATWNGCMGEYGRASDAWVLIGETVELSPVVGSDDFLAKRGTLRVVPFRGRYALAKSEDISGEQVTENLLYVLAPKE